MTPEQEEIFEKYIDKGFSKDQLEEIRLGVESGVDVFIYARQGISKEDMAYIRKCLNLKSPGKAPEIEEDFEKVDMEYKEYQTSVQLTVYEKIVGFSVTIASLAVLAAIYTMIMSWPLIT